jgi:acyl carrier protein
MAFDTRRATGYNPDDVSLIQTNLPSRAEPLNHKENFMNPEIYAKVKDIIIDKLNVDEEKIVPEARFREDLKADSLDLVELIMAFEETFGGTISDDDAQKITTVGEAVVYLEKASA